MSGDISQGHSDGILEEVLVILKTILHEQIQGKSVRARDAFRVEISRES